MNPPDCAAGPLTRQSGSAPFRYNDGGPAAVRRAGLSACPAVVFGRARRA